LAKTLNVTVEEANGFIKEINDLDNALTAMTEERDELLLRLANIVVEQSEQRVDPAKMIGMFGDALKEAIKSITGRVD
jgi:hypothetical protein